MATCTKHPPDELHQKYLTKEGYVCADCIKRSLAQHHLKIRPKEFFIMAGKASAEARRLEKMKS